METLMNRFFGPEGFWTGGDFVPKTNVAETETEYEVTVDLPGLKPEDFTVELKNGELWIIGERKEEKEQRGKTFHRVERHCGEFRRIVPFPTAVAEDKVTAQYTEGVLKVTVPKTEELKPRHIAVKTT